MKNLKYLLATLMLFVAASQQKASALEQPYLLNLRSQITNQLTIASNTVPVDKKLIAKLKASLKIADKPTTNTLAAYTKKVATLIPSLNKASVSNIFDAEVQLILDLYLADYIAARSNQVAILATAYPGSKQIAAQKALNKLQASIDGMNTNLLSNPAAKHLSAASKNLIATTKAVANAKKAKAPASSVIAKAPGTSVSSFKSRPEAAVAAPFPGNSFVVYGVATSGTGFKTKFANLSFELKNLTPGVNNVNIPVGSANMYTIGSLGGAPQAFISTGGTAQVTWIEGAKTLVGTFSFNATQQGGSATTTLSGSFTVRYP